MSQAETTVDHRNSAVAYVLAEHGDIVNPIDLVLPTISDDPPSPRPRKLSRKLH
jgi:hypothetical protein